jgi:dTDP-4-amino-4,6-dideoxygalactose transaminase
MLACNENANYLRDLLKDIPGIEPQKLYDGTTRASYYFMDLRYDKKHFNNLSRDTFAKAMRAEGVSISVGRSPLSTQEHPSREINAPAFRRLYAKEKRSWFLKTIPCPVAEEVMAEEVLRLSEPRFLTTKADMEVIAEAVRKIQAHSEALSSD